MNVKLVYVWPNLTALTFLLTELNNPDIRNIIATLNNLYGVPRVFDGHIDGDMHSGLIIYASKEGK